MNTKPLIQKIEQAIASLTEDDVKAFVFFGACVVGLIVFIVVLALIGYFLDGHHETVRLVYSCPDEIGAFAQVLVILVHREQGKPVEFRFDDHRKYLAKFTEIKEGYEIDEERTMTDLVVRPKPRPDELPL